jgi:hypothetical protein
MWSLIAHYVHVFINSSEYNHLWWLILGVSLTGLSDTKEGDKKLLLGVSVKVFPEQTGMWSRNGVGKTCHHWEWYHSHWLGTCVEQESGRRAKLSSSSGVIASLLLLPWISDSRFFILQALDPLGLLGSLASHWGLHHWLLWSQDFQILGLSFAYLALKNLSHS